MGRSIATVFGFRRKEKDNQSTQKSNQQYGRNSLDSSRKNSLHKEATRRNANLRQSVDGARSVRTIDSNTTGGSEYSYADDVDYERDEQTGERKDHTDLIHALGDEDSAVTSNLKYIHTAENEEAERVQPSKFYARLTLPVWNRVYDLLQLSDLAILTLAAKPFQTALKDRNPLSLLREEGNEEHRINTLRRLDRAFPKHLLCFDCGVYHKRLTPGKESLKPINVANPVYECPNLSNPKKVNPRLRITFGRAIPLTFAQLVTRAEKFSPEYGVSYHTLSRRYKDRVSSWSHQTRFTIISGKLLMRVVSQTIAQAGLPPAGLRHLLYSREDFVPFFSVCPHWRDGELLPAVKCALSHIPKPIEGSGINRVGKEVQQFVHRPNPIITLCQFCRPMRRCPKCPSEYLIELKMVEDKSDPMTLFKQGLQITRWADLGDGSGPWTPEWAACSGTGEYDSFKNLGKRAVSGTFEAEFNVDTLPGQKLISMNPAKVDLGEKGHDWY